MKKVIITNKVTTHFCITPFKPISYTLHATTLAGSRLSIKEVAAQAFVGLFENKENTRSLLLQMSMFDTVIGQTDGDVSSDQKKHPAEW